jgi:hypothetical protein
MTATEPPLPTLVAGFILRKPQGDREPEVSPLTLAVGRSRLPAPPWREEPCVIHLSLAYRTVSGNCSF